ncbi:putative CENPB DNA-binding domain-containing protein 1 [Palaemon carinicauda]|uniref:putative CENPB DNA-binding domain-containing protein 1 n=1 Tax=Palaemon carinicauda TaxID=392227 RepID=UPI0035B6812F
MGPKIASDVIGRSKKMITIEKRLEIIKKYEKGMRIVTLASTYGRNQSTIATIIKNKAAIKASKSSKGMTVLTNGGTLINDEMEKLLLLWIKEKEIDGETFTRSVISHKASAIFADLVKPRETAEAKERQSKLPKSSRLLMGGLIGLGRGLVFP